MKKKLRCGFANGKCVGTYIGRTSGGHRTCEIHLEIYEKTKNTESWRVTEIKGESC